LFVALTFVYGIIAIHDIPYEIAKARNHPHQDAIRAAGGSVSSCSMPSGCGTFRTYAYQLADESPSAADVN
jgi:hypothetical protein